MQSSTSKGNARQPSSKRKRSSDDHNGLPSTKIRRNYVCKDCSYGTTNPREFLYHQRDYHDQRGPIHECPYCIYASPHTHKLNRHITIVHTAKQQQQQQQHVDSTKMQLPPPSSSPASSSSGASVFGGDASLPPPPLLLHSAAPAPAPGISLPPELEVILVDDENGSSVGSLKTTMRPLRMEPSVSVLPIPPPPKLLTRPKSPPPPVPSKQAPKKPPTTTTLLKTALTSQLKEHSCSICSFKSKSRLLVHRHEKVSHLKKKFFRCTKCNYVTNVRSRYTKHVRYHSMPYVKCELCDFSTPYKWNLDRHKRHHLEPGMAPSETGQSSSSSDGLYRCERCSFLGTGIQSLNMHMLNHHGGKPRPRRIENSFSPATNRSSGDEVTKEEEDDDDAEEEEEEEEEEEDDEPNVDDETSDMKAWPNCEDDDVDDDDDEGALMIDEDEKSDGADSDGRDGHSEVTCENGLDGEEPDGGSNDGVDKSDDDDDGRPEKEEEEEDEEEPQLSTTSNMTNKQSNDENGEDGSVYTCTECGDRFSTVALLDRHMYECHDIENPRIPPRRKLSSAKRSGDHGKHAVKCDICPYEAKWVSEMVKHRRVHSREKPFLCPHCDFRSRWKGDITRHVAKYHGGGAKDDDDDERLSLDENGASADDDDEDDAAMVSENIECLMDQSMMVGGEEELCLFSDEQNEQDIPLDLSYAAGGGGMLDDEASDDMFYPGDVVVDSLMHANPLSDSGILLSGGKIARKKYQCPHCTYLTPTPSRFHMHIVAHLNPKPFMCSECGYRSNWQWDITKHAKMKSIRDPNHLNASVVLVNEYGTANYDRYEQYLVYETGGGAVLKALRHNGDQHQRLMPAFPALPAPPPPQKITYKCKHCDFKSSVKKTVMRHMVVHSDSKNARFWCGVCGQSSNWKHVILRHCHHVHGTSGPILLKDSMPDSPPCPEEEAKKALSDDVQQELESEQQRSGLDDVVGAEDDGLHRCSICPYRCQKLFDLRIHSYLHRPREGATFKCMFCPFYVSLKRSWLNHMKLHVDQPQEYSKLLQEISEKPELGDCSRVPVVPSRRRSHDSLVDGVVIKQEPEGDDDDDEPLDDQETPEGVPRVWVNRNGTFLKMFKCRHCPHVSKKRAVIVAHEIMHRRRKLGAGKASYKCPHCNYTSKNAGVLTSHQKVHQQLDSVHSYVDSADSSTPSMPPTFLNNIPPKPSLCASTMMEGGKLKIKITKSGGSNGNFSVLKPGRPTKVYHCCTECPAQFEKLEQMLSHRTFHSADLPYRCDKCSYTARHRPHLHKHERVHTAEYQNSFPKSAALAAPVAESSPGRDLLTMSGSEHEDNASVVASEPKGAERKHRCQMCPAVFLKYSTLIYHMHLHNSNGKFKCDQCTYSVSNIGNLARHTKVHVAPGSPTAKLAPTTTQSRPRQRSAPRQKPRYACDKCPAVFEKRMRFDVHTTLHGSNFRFQCDRCDYAVNFAAILTRHKALHETALELNVADENKEPVLPTADLSAIFKGHLLNTTTAPPPPSSPPAAQSLMSPVKVLPDSPDVNRLRTLAQKQKLILQQMHRVTNDVVPVANDGKKLFCCDRCPYVHQRKDAVQSHLKRHVPTGQETNRCPYCDYGTTIHSFLREHIKLHFKPFQNHNPEGYVRWEGFQVCAKSDSNKTIVYKHRVNGEEELADNETSVVKVSLSLAEGQVDQLQSEIQQLLAEIVWQVEEREADTRNTNEGVRETAEALDDEAHEARNVADHAAPNDELGCTSDSNCSGVAEGTIVSSTGWSSSHQNRSDERRHCGDFPQVDLFKRMVGTSSPSSLLLQQQQEQQQCKRSQDSAEYREYMEVALCLGYSS